jgi:hemin uptake protein HemP
MPSSLTSHDSNTLTDLKTFFEKGELHLIEGLDFKLETQNGNCCKPLAAYHLHFIMKQLEHPYLSAQRIKVRYMPRFYESSLNDSLYAEDNSYMTAIKKMGSVVGETYGSERILKLLTEYNLPTRMVKTESTADYIEKLQGQLANSLPALVFFDAGEDKGYPVAAASAFEHGAVVVGYGMVDGITYFITGHWQEFHIVEATQLAISAHQLIEKKPETFHFVTIEDTKRWLTAEDLVRYRRTYKTMIDQLEACIEIEAQFIAQNQALATAIKNIIQQLPILEFFDPQGELFIPCNGEIYPLTIEKAQKLITQIENLQKRQILLKQHLSTLQATHNSIPTSFDDSHLTPKLTQRATLSPGAQSLASTLIFATRPESKADDEIEQLFKRPRI